MVTYAYFLLDPVSRVPRYVGITTNPSRRLSRHLGSSASTAVSAWVASLQPKQPIMQVLDNPFTSSDSAKLFEVELIRLLRAEGADLLNVSDGGGLPPNGYRWTHSEESRQKIRAALTGIPKSPAHRAALSESCSGWTLDEEAREKIRAARAAIPPAIEQAQNRQRSEAMKATLAQVSPDERSRRIRAGWDTRRANASVEAASK